MDFKALLQPYADPDPQGNPVRTIEGQIKWLNKKGIPRNLIDQAIWKVYDELDRGLKFESDDQSNAGHKLDQYLLKVSQEMQQSELSKQAQELEAFMTTFKQNAIEEYVKAQQGSVWKRMKAVFKPL